MAPAAERERRAAVLKDFIVTVGKGVLRLD